MSEINKSEFKNSIHSASNRKRMSRPYAENNTERNSMAFVIMKRKAYCAL